MDVSQNSYDRYTGVLSQSSTSKRMSHLVGKRACSMIFINTSQKQIYRWGRSDPLKVPFPAMSSHPLDIFHPSGETHLGGSASLPKDKSDVHKGHQKGLSMGTEPSSLDTSGVKGTLPERVVGEIRFNTVPPPLQQRGKLAR
ncbi:hypothetical protein CDAR_81751 [Caerostris darwini]|uniref:Uncharacterized protein n=1 Tax=Caerostris darwini TaxID=1538125 RepID=A0AAV4WIS6_9ARAC|nr:hypothetical protein CDAR_81751 [Caerostris darwini]